MNLINHFFIAFNILFILFNKSASVSEIVFFSLMFSVLIDFDQIIGKYLGKPEYHRRTWLEEPLGLVFFGIPISLVLGTIKTVYLPMTVISYATHIILDYLFIHEVSPFAPFYNKCVKVGFFKSMFLFPPFKEFLNKYYYGHLKEYKGKGISEIFILIPSLILFLIFVL